MHFQFTLFSNEMYFQPTLFFHRMYFQPPLWSGFNWCLPFSCRPSHRQGAISWIFPVFWWIDPAMFTLTILQLRTWTRWTWSVTKLNFSRQLFSPTLPFHCKQTLHFWTGKSFLLTIIPFFFSFFSANYLQLQITWACLATCNCRIGQVLGVKVGQTVRLPVTRFRLFFYKIFAACLKKTRLAFIIIYIYFLRSSQALP